MSAPHRAWLAAGQPPHPYARTAATGPCATCAAPLDDGAVALSEIETPAEAAQLLAVLNRACSTWEPRYWPTWLPGWFERLERMT